MKILAGTLLLATPLALAYIGKRKALRHGVRCWHIRSGRHVRATSRFLCSLRVTRAWRAAVWHPQKNGECAFPLLHR